MEPAQRRLAERRLVAALRRLHRREPLHADVRIDALLAEVRSDPGERRPAAHRGAGSLATAADAELRAVVDDLAARGTLVRSGRRVRLESHRSAIDDPEMQARVERLLAGLAELGAQPPRVEGLAARLGIPGGVVDELRTSGAIVSIGEGIDYPSSVLVALMERLAAVAAAGPLTVGRVRDALRTSRRHAEALLAYRRAEGVRRAPASRGPAARDRRGVR
jgi:selenocysteine-specific elongation factor